MKTTVAILAAMAVLSLPGCRSRQLRPGVEQTRTYVATDTTRTAIRAETRREATLDTARTDARTLRSGRIEFIPDGGTVRIDSSGGMTLSGVAAIAGSAYSEIAQTMAGATSSDTTTVTMDRAAGLSTENHESHIERPAIPATARPWYQTALMRLGQGVLIAVILWLIFLYLRRRR